MVGAPPLAFSASISRSTATLEAAKVDGVIKRSAPSMISLAAYVDAVMAGADESDADNIAESIAARQWPTLEERLAVFQMTGPWTPSPEPFK